MKRLKVILNWVGISLIIILIASFVFIHVAAKYHIGWKKYGPYHRAAMVVRFDYNDSVKVLENKYLISLHQNIYSLNKGEATFINETSAMDTISYENNRLYIVNSQNIVIIDSDGNHKTLNLRASFILNGFAYKAYYYSFDECRIARFYLPSCDQDLSFELFVKVGSFFVIDNHRFFNKNNTNFIYDGLSNEEGYAQLFNYTNNDHSLCWNGGKIDYDSTRIVKPISSIKNGIFYYSSTELLENDKCLAWKNVSKYVECLCGFGASEIYRVDTHTSAKVKVYETKSGSIPIHATDDFVGYYCDGCFYENDNLVQNSIKIETGEDYYEYGKTVMSYDSYHSYNYLGYINGYYYCVVADSK